LVRHIVSRARRHAANAGFYRQTRRILDTPPIRYEDAPLTIVSMVDSPDVQMYLLAVKSLYRRLGRGRIVAIVPRGFPRRKRDLIVAHLGQIEFQTLDEIDTGSCQRGKCWERLMYIADKLETDYVVQIDSDVLCFGPIEEVVECIEQGRSFTLAEGIPVQPLRDWVDKGRARGSDHIVPTFEVRAEEFPAADEWLYIRGSAGFAGFSVRSGTRELVEIFHEGGMSVHKERWLEWGTEQIASNLVVANSPNSVGLPYPKYACFEPGYATFQKNGVTDDMSLLHFIGVSRFDGGVYAALANREIDAMLGRVTSTTSHRTGR
jgi:hypothetical protein